MNIYRPTIKQLLTAAIIVAVAFVVFNKIFIATAQINPLYNFKGKVTTATSTPVADGVYDLGFALYTGATGGASSWSESLTAASRFSAAISSSTVGATTITYAYGGDANESTLRVGQHLSSGSSTALIVDFDTTGNTVTVAGTAPVWANGAALNNRPRLTGGVLDVDLGTVSGLASVNFNQPLYLEVTFNAETMQPRKLISSVPQAFNAARLNGLDSSAFTTTSGDVTATGRWTINNTLRVATSSATTSLTVTQSGVGDILRLNNGTSDVLAVLANGNVGIGTSTPAALLTVGGTSGSQFMINSSGAVTAGIWQGSPLGVAYGGTGVTTFAANSILFATTTNVIGQILPGGEGYIMSIVSGRPTWAATVSGAAHSLLSPSHSDTSPAGVFRGDLITGQAGPVWGRLALGNDGYILRAAGGDITWSTTTAITALGTITAGAWNANTISVAYGGTGSTTLTTNGVLYGDGTNPLRATAAGQNGYLLYSANGTPGWIATSSLGLSTTNISEGNNLYWTNDRFDARLAATTTLPNLTTLSNLSVVGTITAGSWNGSTIGVAYGGTGTTTFAANAILFATSTNVISQILPGGEGYTLSITGGKPAWVASSTGAAHGLLSVTHLDTTAAAVARGDLITGQGVSSTWSRLALGANGYVLYSNGTDAVWTATSTLGIGLVGAGAGGQFPYYAGAGTTLTATSSLFLGSSGNLGVGTTSPASRLTVFGNILAEGVDRYLNFGTTTGTSSYGMRDLSGVIQIKHSSGNWTDIGSGIVGVGSSGYLPYYAAAGTAVSATSSLYLNSLGYLGLGTTSPSERLFVQGNIKWTGNILPYSNTESIGGVAARVQNGYFTNLDVLNMTVGSTTISGAVSNVFTINSDNATADLEDSSLAFHRGTLSPDALLTWNSTADRLETNFPLYTQSNNIITLGKIGIGTTSPYARLEVVGQALAEYFTATSTSATSTFPRLSATQSSLGTVIGGAWNANTISVAYGGTGSTTLTTNGILYGAGTGAIRATAAGQNGYLLYSANGTPGWIATSSLGLSTTNISEGNNLYWTNDRFDTRLAATTTLPNLTTLSNLSVVGTITAGSWNGSTIGVAYGGTGTTTFAANAILFATSTNVISQILPGGEGYTLSITGGKPTWVASSTGAAHGLLSISHTDVTATSTLLRGDIITAQGATSRWSRLALGGNGQLLRSDGTDIYWADVSGLGTGTVNPGTAGQIAYYAANGSAVNGTSSIFITAAGNVGVGTTTAASLLTVGATSGSQFIVNNTGVVTAGAWQGSPIGVGYGGTGTTTFSANAILFATSTNVISQIFPGSNGQVLSMVSGRPNWSSTAPSAPHEILSTFHSDATPGTVTRGDLIAGQGASATWSRLALGANGYILYSNGTDAVWSATSTLGLLPTAAIASGTPGWLPYYANYNNTLSATSSLYLSSLGYLGLGTTSPSERLFVQGNIKWTGNILPYSNTESIGGVAARVQNGYFTNLDVLNMTVGSTTISGAVSNVFTINSDNATADLEDSSLAFHRGTISPDALLTWNSTADRLEMNFPLYTQSNNIITLGNIGAGTTTPGEKLSVVGNIAVSGTVDGYDISNYGQYFIDSAGTYGQLWRSNGSGRGAWIATSSLGLSTTNISEGNNLYWTNDRFDARLAATTTLPNLTTLSNLSVVGTITAGSWNGSTIGVAYGGTGTTTFAANALLYASSTNVISQILPGGEGYTLSITGGKPAWVASSTGAAHGLLSISHTDVTATSTLLRGDIITAQGATSRWSRLALGANGYILRSDGTDVSWSTTTAITALGAVTAGAWQAGIISVPYGGTGSSTLTANGILYGAGTGAIQATAAGTNNYLLYSVNGTPGWIATSSLGLSLVGQGAAGYIPYYASAGINLTATSTLFINTNGNVGIGTTTPAGSLTVASGQVLVPAGSFAAPGLSFVGDADSGFYSYAGNAVGLSLGGALRHMFDTSNIYANSGYYFMSDGDTGISSPGGNNQLGFLTGGLERARISSAGYLGLGTTTPAALLTVGATTSQQFLVNNIGQVTAGAWQGSPIGAGYGGTGSTTLTTGGILYGDGANPIKATAQGLNSAVLYSNNGVPSWTATGTNGYALIISGGVPTWSSTSPGAAHPLLGAQHLDTNAAATPATGDLLTFAGSVWDRLPASTTGTVLRIVGGAPVWSATSTLGLEPAFSILSVAKGGTGSSTLTTNGVLYGNGAGAVQATAQGVNGYVLWSNNGTPAWVATSSLGISSGGSGTVSSSTQGYVAYYGANGTTVSGTSSLFIASNGYIGFGTTSPSALLTVGNNNQFTVDSSGNVVATSIRLGSTYNIDNGGLYVSSAARGGINSGGQTPSGAYSWSINSGDSGSYNDGFINFNTSGVERMRIIANGNIGIGTSSPLAKLDVYGNAILSGANRYLNFGTATGTGGYGFYDNSGTLQFKNSGGSWANISTSTIGYGTTGQIPYYSASSSNLTATSALFIASNGYVGIGKTNPGYELDVEGAGRFTKDLVIQEYSANTYSPSGGFVQPWLPALNISNDYVVDNSGTMVLFSSRNAAATYQRAYIGATVYSTGYTPAIVFGQQTGASSYNERMRIDSSGNIGIGTSSPYAKLTVWGTGTTTAYLANFVNSASTTLLSIQENGTITMGSGAFQYDGTTGVTSIDNINLGSLNFDTDAGVVSWVDMPIATTTAGIVNSYTAQLDGNPLLTVYGETDGLGGIRYGSIGIGTTTPVAQFAIQAGTSTRPLFDIASTSGASLLRILASGYVGIGTTSPSALLTVGATSSQQFLVNNLGVVTGGTWQGSPIGVAYGGTGTSTTPSYGQLLMGNAASGYNLVATSSLGLMSGSAIGSGNTGWIPYYAGSGSNLTATSALFIAADGKIGIGTTAPSQLLTVGNNNQFNVYSDGTVVSTKSGFGRAVMNGNNGALEAYANDFTNALYFYFDAGASGQAKIKTWRDGVDKIPLLIAAKEIKFNVGQESGVDRELMRLTVGGVGIGTTSPLALLDVYGSAILSGANRYLNFGTATGTSGYGFFDNAGTMQWKNASGSWTNFSTSTGSVLGGTAGQVAYYGVNGTTVSGTSSIFITPTGFVGIGTTTPSTKLTVVSTAGSQLRLAYDATKYADFTVNSAGELNISMNSATSGSTVVIGDNSPENVGVILAGSSSTFHLAIDNTDNVFKIGTSTTIGSSTLLTITSTGDVGIGTTTPTAKLLVQGDTSYLDYTMKLLNSAGTEFLSLRDDGQLLVNNTDLQLAGDRALQSYSSGAEIRFTTGGSGSGNINISTLASSGTGRHIILMPYGNVGIGTTSPSALLTVGATSSQQFLVNNLGVVTGGTWQGSPIGVTYGGTGTSTTPSYGQLLMGNTASGYNLVATSSLGLMSGTAIGGGTTGQIPYYAGSGSNLTATSALFIASNGNIGIGTSSPANKLTFYNLADDDGISFVNPGYYTSNIFQDINNGGLSIESPKVFIRQNNGIRATFTNYGGLALGYNTVVPPMSGLIVQGLVGLGTTSPSSKLSVYGDALLEGSNRYLNFGTATGTNGYGFFDNNGVMQWKNASGNWTNFSTSTGAVSIGTAGQLAYYGTSGDVVSGTSSLFIAPSGFVGIGTTTPGSQLTVVSTVGPQLRLAYDGSKYVDFTVASNGEFTISPTGYSGGSIMTIGNNLNENVGMVFAGSSTPFYLALDNTDGALKIGTSTTIGSSTVLTILKNGNVGIGTSTSSNKLFVVSSDTNVAKFQGLGTAAAIQIFRDNISAGGVSNAASIDFATTLDGALWAIGMDLGANGTKDFSVGQGGTNRLLIKNSSGYTGIGTSSPSSKLTVYGDVFLEGSNRYLNFGTATGTNGYGLFDNSGQLQFKNSGSGWTNFSTSTGSVASGLQGQVGFYGANGNTVSGTSSLFIATNGNIGIGTTSASAISEALTVRGNILVRQENAPTARGTITNSMNDPYGVSILGNYAYLVDFGNAKFYIYDVSNPDSIVEMASTTTSIGLAPSSIEVSGKYAYLTNNTSLVIYDVSNPKSIQFVASTSMELTGPRKIAIQGKYAYVVNYTNLVNKSLLTIFDISNPQNINFVSSTTAGSTYRLKDIRVSGKYAYVVGDYNDGIQIYDISNPGSPVAKDFLTISNNVENMDLSGKYLYVTTDTSAGLRIYDISNPDDIITKGSIATNLSVPVGVAVSGKYAYVVDFSNNRFAVFDISNPNSIVAKGYTSTNVTAPKAISITGKYAYVAGGNGSGRLSIFDLGNIDTPTMFAGAIGVSDLQVYDSATINDDLMIRGGLNVGGSTYFQNDFSVLGDASFRSNVGIGTSSPSANLHVYQNAPSANQSLFRISTSDDSSRFSVDEDGDVSMDGSLSALGGIASYNGGGTTFESLTSGYYGLWRIYYDTTYGSKMEFAQGDGGAYDTNLFRNSANYLRTNDSLIIDNNLAIGTSSPSAKLTVWGTGTSTAYLANFVNSASTTLLSIQENGTVTMGNGAFQYDGTTGITSIDSIDLGSMNFDTDSGIITWIDMPVATTTAGIIQSYTAKLDGNPLLTVYGETDGTGGVRYKSVGIGTTTPLATFAVMGEAGSRPVFDIASSTGASFLRVLASGYVGIGTTSPSQALSVNGLMYIGGSGTSTIQNNLQVLGNLKVGTSSLLLTENALTSTGNFTINGITITPAGNMQLPSANSLAIGTSTASSKLTVYGDALLEGSSRYLNFGTATGTAGYGFFDNGGVLQFKNSGGAWANISTSTIGYGTTGQIPYYAASSSNLTATSALFIAANGNLGVGTTGPLAKLHIQGASTPRFRLGNTTDNGSVEIMMYEDDGVGTADGMKIQYDGTSGINEVNFVPVSNEVDGSAVMTIERAGNVGIGTIGPLSKLDVNGGMAIGSYAGTNAAPANGLIISGNTGIGTSTPSAKLTVWGTGTGVNQLVNFVNSASTTLFTVLENGKVGVGTTTPIATFAVTGIAGATPAFEVASSTNASMFRVNANGNVGIGTNNPSTKLDIDSGNIDITSGYQIHTEGYDQSSITMADAMVIGSYLTMTLQTTNNDILLMPARNVGIGTSSPSAKLTVWGSGTTTGIAMNVVNAASTTLFTVLDSGKVGIGTTTPSAYLDLYKSNGSGSDIMFQVSTSTGIGFKITGRGEAISDLAFNSTGADYAEYFATTDMDLQSGEVVCVDVAVPNSVKRCRGFADNDVMGIVSTKPAIVGNRQENFVGNSHYAIIAMLGQIPAKVSAENGPVRPGDSLTSAKQIGYVARANVGDPTVGVALETLNGGNGTINVLISRRNKSLTVEQVEQSVTDRIAAMKIENEVRIMIANSVAALNLDSTVAGLVSAGLAPLDSRLTVSLEELTSQLVNTKADVALLAQQVAVLGEQMSNFQISISNKIQNLNDQIASSTILNSNSMAIDAFGNIKMGNNIASATSPTSASLSAGQPSPAQGEGQGEVAIVEIDALSTATALVVRQAGDGKIAEFQGPEVSVMTVEGGGEVKIVGTLGVDGRILVCSGGVCPAGLDNSVDSTLGDVGVEGKVVAGAYESYCADGFVWVSGSSKYGTMPGFCLQSGVARHTEGRGLDTDLADITNASSTPWVNISQGEAAIACQSVGDNYHLITENEWLTVAENALRIGDNDIDKVTAGLQFVTTSTSTALVMSNGGLVYDIIGTISQWTDQTITKTGLPALANSTPEAIGSWQEYYNVDDYQGLNIAPPYYYTAAQNGIGQLLLGAGDANLRGFLRGYNGLYSLDLSNAPTMQSPVVGFRCAK